MAQAYFEVPLTGQAQQFQISLAGQQVVFRVTWCAAAQYYLLDILDLGSVPIVTGIPIIPGVNLLEQYDYLDLGGALVCQSTPDPNVPPTFTNLGTESHLYFITDQS